MGFRNTNFVTGYGPETLGLLISGDSGESVRRSNSETFRRLIGGMDQNPTVSSALIARSGPVSQVKFFFRDTIKNNVVRSKALRIFESVPGGLPSLLMKAESDIAYYGNAYFYRKGDTLKLLRPDLVEVVLASSASPDAPEFALDAEIVGYLYGSKGEERSALGTDEVAHWRAEPHPVTPWLGGSWIQGVLREISADAQADQYTTEFFNKGPSPRMLYKMDPKLTAESVSRFREQNEVRTSGVSNAHKTLYIGGATDVVQLNTDISDIDLKALRGALETKIAMRSRVPAVVLGIAEGMQGSALNAGNYAQARNLWADTWFSPHVGTLAAALERIVWDLPAGCFLAPDWSGVLLMQEEKKDAAEIQAALSNSIRALTDGGYSPGSVVAAVTSGDLTKLSHTGMLPVQVQAPVTDDKGQNE